MWHRSYNPNTFIRINTKNRCSIWSSHFKRCAMPAWSHGMYAVRGSQTAWRSSLSSVNKVPVVNNVFIVVIVPGIDMSHGWHFLISTSTNFYLLWHLPYLHVFKESNPVYSERLCQKMSEIKNYWGTHRRGHP